MTAYGMRISDWSSDVCCSDLPADEKTAEAPSANILFAARPSEKVEGSTVSVFVSPTADATRGEGHRPEGSEYRRADFVVLNVASGTVDRTYPGGESHAYRLSPDKRFLAFFRSEEHTSELQSLMRLSYAVFCLKKKN